MNAVDRSLCSLSEKLDCQLSDDEGVISAVAVVEIRSCLFSVFYFSSSLQTPLLDVINRDDYIQMMLLFWYYPGKRSNGNVPRAD